VHGAHTRSEVRVGGREVAVPEAQELIERQGWEVHAAARYSSEVQSEVLKQGRQTVFDVLVHAAVGKDPVAQTEQGEHVGVAATGQSLRKWPAEQALLQGAHSRSLPVQFLNVPTRGQVWHTVSTLAVAVTESICPGGQLL
jgi:hypothetical protein